MKRPRNAKRLDEVCLFVNGLWAGKKPPFAHAGVFRNTNFRNDGYLDSSNIAYLGVEARQISTRRLEHGDVILEKSGGGANQPVGRVALFDRTDGVFSFSNFTSALRVIDKSVLDFRFLHKYLYWLHLTGATESMQSYTTGIRNLDTSAYKRVLVPLPSLSEQQRIVSILDTAFEHIAIAKANTERTIANAREVLQAELTSTFIEQGRQWPKRTLASVCLDFGRGKSKHRPRNDPKLFGGPYPFIQTGDIRNANQKVTSYKQAYNAKGLAQSKLWPRGTVCITIAANIAETAILDFEACFPDSVIGCVPNPRLLDGIFLEYLLRAFKVHLQAQSKGSAQGNINLATFEKRKFPVPDIDQQHTIARRMGSFDSAILSLETQYRKRLRLYDDLKESLLHAAFGGKL